MSVLSFELSYHYYSYINKLESSWKVILSEARSILDQERGVFESEDEGLTDTGDWKQYTLYQQGRKNAKACERTPKTCQILDSMPDATTCKRGQVTATVRSEYYSDIFCSMQLCLDKVLCNAPGYTRVSSLRAYQLQTQDAFRTYHSRQCQD